MKDSLDPQRTTNSDPAGRFAKVLIVEDEELFAKAVAKRLTKAGYQTEVANNLGLAEQSLNTQTPDLILLDMRLPDGSGLDFLAKLRNELSLEIPVLVLTAYGELEDAVAAMKLQATDYLKKPIDLDDLLIQIEKILTNTALVKQLEYSRKREQSVGDPIDVLGRHPKIDQIHAQIRHIGSLGADVETFPPTVLILGETGTGKDLVARLLHSSGARRDKPFVHVDCASLPKDLIEAELFGHERGAFTNAHATRIGLIEAAENGVVFLDEIGELPLELQAKLLAVLERRTLRRVGSVQEQPIAAWFIAATNRGVEAMIKNGELRSDLYFRLNVLSIDLPPLRERGNDVILLAEHFMKNTSRRYNLGALKLAATARKALTGYTWPGNVRELKHLLERAALVAQKGEITEDILMINNNAPGGPVESPVEWERITLDDAERQLIERALQRTNDNVSEAARQLGVTRMAMRYRMKKYGLA